MLGAATGGRVDGRDYWDGQAATYDRATAWLEPRLLAPARRWVAERVAAARGGRARPGGAREQPVPPGGAVGGPPRVRVGQAVVVLSAGTRTVENSRPGVCRGASPARGAVSSRRARFDRGT
ncbi:hypothetical protein CBP52_10465 [Cellulomonas sp. PSBB021]|nr:hypothetical protein CBP52_10465 [Cellulomonas sp. PSBB021]